MSVSSVSLSSDANVRYQRLAQEYTKLRAQAKVLREGVLEERSKVEKLTEEVKSKEAVIRRVQSENESLTFRNEQLVRRVENLQLDQPPVKNSPHKPKKSSVTAPEAVSPRIELLEQELRLKLIENEKLVNQLADNERQHAVEMAEMSEKLAKEMRKLEEEVKRMRMRSKVTENIIKTEEKPVENSEKRSEIEEISSPEVPESQEEARLMIAEAARGTFAALNNVFNLFQQRSEIYPYDITMERLPPHVEKLSSEYAQTARLFSDLTEILDGFFTRSAIVPDQELPLVTSKLRLVTRHCHQMLTDLIDQMTSEESRVTWCTPPLVKLNSEWQGLMLKLFAVFGDIATSLEKIQEQKPLASTNIDVLINALESLEEISMLLVDCFQKRWVFESRLPTTTRRMRCVGGALEAALQMMAQETSKLHARSRRVQAISLEEAKEAVNTSGDLPEDIPKEKEPYNPFNDDDESETVREEDPGQVVGEKLEIWPEKSDSVPPIPEKLVMVDVQPPSSAKSGPKSPFFAEIPMENNENRTPDAPEHLKSELSLMVRRNEELQKERDRLFVEFSLCKRKLEIATNDGMKIETKQSVMDEIWAIGMERRNEWIERVHEAEKAVRYYENEFDILLRHELASEESLKQVRSELEALSHQNHQLEDELESVRRSYESQLGDLSEHLASLVKEREKDKEGGKSRGSLKSFFNKSSS